jgi:hypothetical protein
MDYNSTTTKDGLLQSIEFWTNLGDGVITGDTLLKAVFTNRLNRRLDRYLGMLGAGSRQAQIDDTNFTNQPYSYFDIVSGQHDYEFLTDEDGNAISDITAVLYKSGSNYELLDKTTLDDKDATLIMSPNSDSTGTPTEYLERNNTIFLSPVPSSSLEEGGKIFYKRCPSYFATTDTTKEPGIPFQFHEMIAIGASYDWLLVNKSNAQTLITRVEAELMKWEREFRVYVELRNPIKKGFTPKLEDLR